jgi:hypothetical protein
MLCAVIWLGAALTGFAFAQDPASGDPAVKAAIKNPGANFGYGEIINATSCPLLMDLQNVIEDYLVYREKLAITPDQLAALKRVRDTYQEQVLKLNDTHDREVLKLNNILYDNQADIKDIRAISAEIGRIEGEMRAKNIETFIAARDILNRDQLEKAKEQGIRDYPFEYINFRPLLR